MYNVAVLTKIYQVLNTSWDGQGLSQDLQQ